MINEHECIALLYFKLLAHFTCWSKARYVVFSRVSYIVCLVSPIVLNSVSSDHHFLPEFWLLYFQKYLKSINKFKQVWTEKKIRNKQKNILGPNVLSYYHLLAQFHPECIIFWYPTFTNHKNQYTPLSWWMPGWKATNITTNYIQFSSFLWAFIW